MTKKSPSRRCKKKRTPEQVASDMIYDAIQNNPINITESTSSVSKAIQTVRLYEVGKDKAAWAALCGLVKKHQEAFVRGILDDIVESDYFRVADVSVVSDMIAANLKYLPVWDAENKMVMEEIVMASGLMDAPEDDVQVYESGDEGKSNDSVKKIFKSLGDSCPKGDEGEIDV